VGSAGAQGPQGIQGPAGIQGIQGPAGTDASIPAGVIVMWAGLLANIPVGWHLCNGTNGTPDLRNRFIKGADQAADPGTTGGSTTHGHVVTQPADHAALSHAGAAVANHAFTQPGAHSNHVVTQPSAHTFTQPSGHSAHVFTQPTIGTSGAGSAHTHTQGAVTQPTAAAEASHTHTGASAGTTPKLFTSNTSSGVPGISGGGTSHTHAMSGGAVANPANESSHTHAGGTATLGAVDAHSAHAGGAVDAHGGTAVDAHSAHIGGAVDAHGVTQASQHAAQNHSGASVDTVSNEPVYYALAFIQKG
jgi:hypothetical protein